MNSVVHFEIPADDLDASKEFYSKAFGWQISEFPMEDGEVYNGVITSPVDDNQMPTKKGTINGALVQKDDKSAVHPVVTVGVESIEDAITKVEEAGGELVVPKGEVPGMGEYAYIKDPSGNVVGLWHDLTQPDLNQS